MIDIVMVNYYGYHSTYWKFLGGFKGEYDLYLMQILGLLIYTELN